MAVKPLLFNLLFSPLQACLRRVCLCLQKTPLEEYLHQMFPLSLAKNALTPFSASDIFLRAILKRTLSTPCRLHKSHAVMGLGTGKILDGQTNRSSRRLLTQSCNLLPRSLSLLLPTGVPLCLWSRKTSLRFCSVRRQRALSRCPGRHTRTTP